MLYGEHKRRPFRVSSDDGDVYDWFGFDDDGSSPSALFIFYTLKYPIPRPPRHLLLPARIGGLNPRLVTTRVWVTDTQHGELYRSTLRRANPECSLVAGSAWSDVGWCVDDG